MLTDKKLSETSFIGKNVKALPDNPSANGITAKQLKAAFDRSGEEIIAAAVNGVIDELTGAGGATNIGAVGGETVQGHINDRNNPHSVTASQIGAYTKSETDVQINNKIVDIGSADMKKAIYDTHNKNVDIFGYVDTHKDNTTAHVLTLTHALSSTIHTLTGNIPTSGYATVRFKATADYKAGDTFKIGAVVYTAKPTGEEVALPDKAFTTGDVVSCEVDIAGKRINFKSGSTGLPDGWNEKATGEAIEPIAKSAPIVQQIYGSWDTQINSLPPPDVLPSGACYPEF